MVIMLTAQALLTLLIYAHVVFATVLETTEEYSCQKGSQTLKSETASRATDCEQSWTAEFIPIGSFMNGHGECHSPCINVTSGTIVIGKCVNATLTVICYQGHVIEYRTHFVGVQMNILPQQNFKERDCYGIYASLILLVLIFLGCAIYYFISA